MMANASRIDSQSVGSAFRMSAMLIVVKSVVCKHSLHISHQVGSRQTSGRHRVRTRTTDRPGWAGKGAGQGLGEGSRGRKRWRRAVGAASAAPGKRRPLRPLRTTPSRCRANRGAEEVGYCNTCKGLQLLDCHYFTFVMLVIFREKRGRFYLTAQIAAQPLCGRSRAVRVTDGAKEGLPYTYGNPSTQLRPTQFHTCNQFAYKGNHIFPTVILRPLHL